MPDVFDTLENFESFFNFSAVLDRDGHKEIIMQEKKNALVGSLHAILKPFLLRRVKTDVATDLPKKREYILYAPLTAPQKELYKQILEGNSRAYLEQEAINRLNEKAIDTPRSSRCVSRKRKSDVDTPSSNKSVKSSRSSTPARSIRSGRKGRKTYAEISDEQYFKELEESSESESPDEEEVEEMERAKTIALASEYLPSLLLTLQKFANK